MVYKDSSFVVYALCKCIDEEITLENVFNYITIINNSDSFYYKFKNFDLTFIAEEFKEKYLQDKVITVDIVKYNKIATILNSACKDKRVIFPIKINIKMN